MTPDNDLTNANWTLTQAVIFAVLRSLNISSMHTTKTSSFILTAGEEYHSSKLLFLIKCWLKVKLLNFSSYEVKENRCTLPCDPNHDKGFSCLYAWRTAVNPPKPQAVDVGTKLHQSRERDDYTGLARTLLMARYTEVRGHHHTGNSGRVIQVRCEC